MNKQQHFTSIKELYVLRTAILEQMKQVTNQLHTLLGGDPFSALASLKFQKTVADAVFGEELNFIEYLNQSFTYLVCLYAAEQIMREHTGQEILVNFGTQSGYDVMTADGSVVCECFAVTSAGSNQKLKKDVVRVKEAPAAAFKYVFFYDQSAEDEAGYIQRVRECNPNVMICSIPFEKLTKPDCL